MEAAAAAAMMADLGLDRRDLISTQEDEDRPRGGRIRRSARQQAADEAMALADAEAHRKLAQQGATSGTERGRAIAAWNTPSTFGTDEIAENLENRMSGQGHRRQLEQQQRDKDRWHQETFGGRPQMPPPPPRPAPPARTTLNYTTSPRAPTRTRAPSPRAGGTIRITRSGRSGHVQPGQLNQFAASAAAATAAANAAHSRPASSAPSSNAIPRTMPSLTASTPAPPAVMPPTPAFGSSSTTPSPGPATPSQAQIDSGPPATASGATFPGAFPASREASPSPSTSSAGFAAGSLTSGLSVRDILRAKRNATAPSSNRAQLTAAGAASPATEAAVPNAARAQPAPTLLPAATPSSSQESNPPSTSATTNVPPHVAAAARSSAGSESQATSTQAALTTPASTTVPESVSSATASTASSISAQRAPARQRATATTSSGAQAGSRSRAVLPSAQDAVSEQGATGRPTREQAITDQVNDSLAYDAAPNEDRATAFLRNNPSGHDAIRNARRKIARQVVEFALDPESAEARQHVNVWKSHQRLIQLAVQARAGTLSDATTDPMVQAILEATAEALAKEVQAAVQVPEEATNASSSSRPGSASSVTFSGASGSSPATTISSITNAVRGFINVFFFSSNNELRGHRRLSMDAPIRANVHVEAVDGFSDPLELADYMNSWADEMLQRSNGAWEGAQEDS